MENLSHQFVVVAYGNSPYLSACLSSVCGQHPESKVIITTSTPSDYLSSVAKSHGVPVFVGENGGGIASDWNFGLSRATSPLVTLAHQDDIYYPDFVSETHRRFLATPNASLCFTDYEEIDARGKQLPTGRLLIAKRLLRSFASGTGEVAAKQRLRRRLLAFGSVIPCPSVTLNRMAVPDFFFSKDYEINLDWDGWWTLHSLDRPFVFSRRVLMAHRIHDAAETSHGKRDGRRQAEDKLMFSRIWRRPTSHILAKLYQFGY